MPICETCDRERAVEDLFCCEKCGAAEDSELPLLTYCLEHQLKHTRGYHKSSGTPLTVYTKVVDILTTEEDHTKRQDMFVEDLFARWVGVEIPPRAQPGAGYDPFPIVWSSPRMADLLLQSSKSSGGRRNPSQYPSLVSFIGGTGSGKSTLIKSLIRLNRGNNAQPGIAVEPIPSSQATSASLSSTSSDIHLYLDPLTASDEEPILLADSEGLEGGDPISLRALDEENMRQENGEKAAAIPHTHKLASIDWATGPKRDRSHIVGHLYPRFLYTFSDVICFVTNNSRGATKEATELLRWASTGYERTLNQRTPPALIIVMNQPRHVPDSDQWKDPNTAIKFWFMELDKNRDVHEFVELQKEWSQKGMEILKPSDMLKRYYSSIKLVWIPHTAAKGKDLHRPHAEIYSQLQSLHSEIRSAAKEIHKQKGAANLLLTTATFQVYIGKALRHFAKKEFSAFDLEAAAGLVRPAPVIFREHVIAVLLLLKEETPGIPEEKKLLRDVAELIAAAVGFLAYQKSGNDKIKHYIDSEIAIQCKILYNTFLENHWRCEDVHHEKRCTNIKRAHLKGHQYESRPDEIYAIQFRDGEFEAHDAHLMCYEYFTQHIVNEIKELPPSYTPAAHMCRLIKLKPWLGKLKIQRTCLSCLWRTPEHVLPCKHVLCHDCASQFDVKDRKDPAHLWIASCPFGCSLVDHSHAWPWKTTIKPPSSGVRVLTLDGGGIRGIFEIMVLEYLERLIHNLGLKVPVIEMFDLVVGTSTGGIVALGLAHCGWTTTECRGKFTELIKQAFNLRPGMGVPGIRAILKYAYSYIYRTENLERAFKKGFGSDDALFGSSTPVRVKVAVTTVERNREGFRTYLLSNYSRPFSSVGEDRLLRANDPEQELKTWEAARATSAAPLFFKAFTHPHTSQILADGALRHDNPIRKADQERYALWGTHCFLDLHLSLGTGFLPEPSDSPWRPPSASTGLGVMAGIAKEFVRAGMNAQEQYETFVSSVHPKEQAERYMRLNVDIDDGGGKTPIDRTNDAEMKRLQEMASRYCLQPGPTKEMESIARRLVASCFFFADERWKEARGVWVCRGTLGSRLPLDRWEELKGFLDKGLGFVVRMEDSGEMTEKEIIITSSQDSMTQGCFRMEVEFEVVRKGMKDRNAAIALLFERGRGEREECMISGFPRVITGRET